MYVNATQKTTNTYIHTYKLKPTDAPCSEILFVCSNIYVQVCCYEFHSNSRFRYNVNTSPNACICASMHRNIYGYIKMHACRHGAHSTKPRNPYSAIWIAWLSGISTSLYTTLPHFLLPLQNHEPYRGYKQIMRVCVCVCVCVHCQCMKKITKCILFLIQQLCALFYILSACACRMHELVRSRAQVTAPREPSQLSVLDCAWQRASRMHQSIPVLNYSPERVSLFLFLQVLDPEHRMKS